MEPGKEKDKNDIREELRAWGFIKVCKDLLDQIPIQQIEKKEHELLNRISDNNS